MHFNLYCLEDVVTCTGDWEIWSVFGRLLDNPEELAETDVVIA